MDNLINVAGETAMRGAAEYLAAHNLVSNDDKALCECIKSWIKINLPQALADAKEALDAGMEQAANATFLLSMKLAGIEAAKECGLPKELANLN